MKCPHCHSEGSVSRMTSEEAARIRRRYACTECGTAWTTVENLWADSVKVPSDWREAARRMWRSGLSFRAIGKKLGRCHQTIAYNVSGKARSSYQNAGQRYERDPGVREARQIKQRLSRTQHA